MQIVDNKLCPDLFDIKQNKRLLKRFYPNGGKCSMQFQNINHTFSLKYFLSASFESVFIYIFNVIYL